VRISIRSRVWPHEIYHSGLWFALALKNRLIFPILIVYYIDDFALFIFWELRWLMWLKVVVLVLLR
jgi:hypothetical protein